MGLVSSFAQPFASGALGTSADVPGRFRVSIGGRAYPVNTSFEPYRREAFRQRSIDAARQSIDYTNIPGEGTISTEGLWRREEQDWINGSGQLFADRHASVDNRFRRSKGVNPWTQWQLSLLHDTTRLRSSGDSDQQLLVVGNYLYHRTSTALAFSSDGVSWTTVTGTPAAVKCIASDGYNVWIAGGGNGIYTTTAGASSASSAVSGTVNFIAYAGDRIIAAASNVLYNVTTLSGSLPSALMTHEDSSFVWSTCCGGSGWIYVGGVSNNYSEVYRTQVEPNGTQLAAPVISAPMPHGELVYSLYSNTNFVHVGTNLGARFCETLGVNDPGGNAGDLKLGPIIPGLEKPVTLPVRCFVSSGRYAWFGWSNYDGISTGIGRMDISHFIDAQAPAYASDLMVTAQGEVLSMDLFLGAPVFAVSGQGVYTQSANLVAEGTIDSGYETFGIPDDKVAITLAVKPSPGSTGSISATVTVDGGTPAVLPSQPASNGLVSFDLPQLRGELFETELQLFPDPGLTTGPTIHRQVLEAYPAVATPSMISCVINLFRINEDNQGNDYPLDPYAEWEFLEGLRRSREVIEYVEGPYNVLGTVDSIDRMPYRESQELEGGFEMVCVVYIKTLD